MIGIIHCVINGIAEYHHRRMRWKVRGKLIWHSDSRYRIDWIKSAPSKGAQQVKDFLLERFRNDAWFEEYRLPRCALRIDFLNATRKFAVEFNGRQHREYLPFFHGDESGRARAIERDLAKIGFLEGNGYKVIEVYDEDLRDLSKVFAECGIVC